MTEAWIIDACRTPRGVGKVGKGALAELHTGVLGAATLTALAERNDLDTSVVDDVIWGCSLQVGTQGGALGRMTALDAGWDVSTSGFTLDRYCGSGITAVNLAAGMVASGFEDVLVAGGAEMMSSYGENQSKTRHPFMDKGNEHLRELHPQSNQGVCADAIATLEGISREALDALGAESQRRAAVAIAEGRFDKSLVPVHAPDGRLLLDHEEYPRPNTTLEGLAQLQPAFAGLADIELDEQGRTFRGEILRRYPGLELEHGARRPRGDTGDDEREVQCALDESLDQAARAALEDVDVDDEEAVQDLHEDHQRQRRRGLDHGPMPLSGFASATYHHAP